MKAALRENRRLIMLTLIVLVVALIITLTPALQAEAQTGCYRRTTYTCMRRRGRRICCYFTYTICPYRFRSPFRYRGR